MNARLYLHLLFAWVLAGFVAGPARAQGGHYHHAYHTWPDDLNVVTVTGVVTVTSTTPQPMYALDENGDGVADFHLSFGPWWYEPTTGASRPEAGETVTVLGALLDDQPLLTLLVFEIDGVVWRTCIEYGSEGWNAEPVWDTFGSLLTVTGAVQVDTTYFYTHYYLDATGNGVPDYKLGLGPPWYDPASGAQRPEDGQTITVFGRLHPCEGIDLLTVLELDGLTWRPMHAPAPWAGQWIRRRHASDVRAYAANNAAAWIDFRPGHMGNGNGPASWPDSVFVQFWETHPDSLPGPHHERRFVGYYVGVHDPQGLSLMNGQYGGHTLRIRFEHAHRIRLAYDEAELAFLGLSENDLRLQAWNAPSGTWDDVPEAVLDTRAHVIVLESTDLNTYYALLSDEQATHADAENLPDAFFLHQNYPNPCNPSTTIPFTLHAPQHVVLTVHDLLGRTVATLVDATLPAGRHTVFFTAGALPGGVYLYRLHGDAATQHRFLVLVK